MGDERYQIIYTESAVQDLEEKVAYISFHLQEPSLAETWYLRLRTEILSSLCQFPFKFPLYPVETWRAKGIRQFTFRNDVILYSVNKPQRTVYIWAVCTKGRDLSAHLATLTELPQDME